MVYSLLSPGMGEKENKEKEETLSFVCFSLQVSSCLVAAEETTTASSKGCHGFDKSKHSAL